MKHVVKKLGMILLLLIASLVNAQEEDPLRVAIAHLQKGTLDSAKMVIDQLITNTQAVKDGNVWYYRGFIYKSIYNKWEKKDKHSNSRLEALKAFKQSLAMMDTSKTMTAENKKNIKYLTTTLYNDASSSLDSLDYKTGIETFELFKEYYPLVDSSPEALKKYDIKFLQALGSVYAKIFEDDKSVKPEIKEAYKNQKGELLKLAVEAYNKILILDTLDNSAYYNIGTLYYQQGVNLIRQLDYSTDIPTLDEAQNNTYYLYRQSLPFMEKAYKIEPNRREVLYGLYSIYYSLNEIEKSNEFKRKLDEIEKK
ncbi:MAG TPA: hypothetical protein PK289_07090 [Bacteroidia bacterium]|jgi:hypothetical protein|nr:hypothetical protein [Bacteroidia bacterium]